MENTSSKKANLFFLEDVDRNNNLDKIVMLENGLIFACLQSVSNYKHHCCIFKCPLPNDDIIAKSCKIDILEPRVFTSNYSCSSSKARVHTGNYE